MRIVSLEGGMERAVSEALAVLKAGGVLAFPTETTYGLGCDPRNPAALGKIYRIKGRDASKALPLVSCSLEQVKQIFEIIPQAEQFVASHWPGALTILLEPKDLSLRKHLPVYKDGFSAIRASSHPFVMALTCSYGFPIVATSANSSGQKACLSLEDLESEFGGSEPAKQPDLVIDGGRLEPSEPSTIIKLNPTGEVEVIRQGAVRL